MYTLEAELFMIEKYVIAQHEVGTKIITKNRNTTQVVMYL